ncbi:MAG: hypothetical protein ACRERD_14095, partial [Candidatus Binatia bacterium]
VRTMAIWSYIFKGLTALLFVGLATNAQGFEEDARALVVIKGEILCMDCKMEELMKTQEQKEKSGQIAEEESGKFLELRHDKGQLIISRAESEGGEQETKLTQDFDNKQQIQNRVGLSEHIRLRAEEPVLRHLASEAHLHKELEIKGLLRNDRTMDVGSIKVAGVELQSSERGGEPAGSSAEPVDATE